MTKADAPIENENAASPQNGASVRKTNEELRARFATIQNLLTHGG